MPLGIPNEEFPTHEIWRGLCVECDEYLEYIGDGNWKCGCGENE